MWVFFGIIAAYFGLRWYHIQRLDTELNQTITLTKGNDGVYRYLREYENHTEQANRVRQIPIEAAAAGAITAYDAFYALSLLDAQVLKAADFASSADLASFAHVTNWLAHSTDGLSGIALDGAINRLVGYTGEQEVAAHLVAAGHIAEFPATANQAGYDLLVDGHPVQVKTTLSPELINQHLERYPDVPVITNTEMAHHFANNSHVIIDPELSHGNVAESVHSTLHAADMLHAMGFHIPWVTLAVTSLRETGLLLKGWTDLQTAVKNMLIDTAGVGIGGTFGAKLGATVGAAGGPLTAAVGAIVGAIGGAIGGKYAISKVKAAPLKRAMDDFNTAMGNVARCFKDACQSRLTAITRHNKKVGCAIPRTWLSLLWPQRSDLLRNHVQARCAAQAQEMEVLISQAEEQLKAKGSSAAGRWVMEQLKETPVFSPALRKAIDDAMKAYRRVQREMQRLGHDPEAV